MSKRLENKEIRHEEHTNLLTTRSENDSMRNIEQDDGANATTSLS